MSDLIRSNRDGMPPSRLPGQSLPASGEVDSFAGTIGLRDALAILRRHFILILAVTVVITGIAAVVVLRQVSQYRAVALIRLQDARGEMTGGIGGTVVDQAMGKAADPILSELQVLKSRGVAEAVVAKTGLRLAPADPRFPRHLVENVVPADRAATDTLQVVFGERAYTARSGDAAESAPYGESVALPTVQFTVAERPEDRDEVSLILRSSAAAIEGYRTALQASIREKTDAIDIAYQAPDPAFAQRVVNATVVAFQDLNASQAQQKAHRRRIFVEEQLAQTDSVLARAQTALANFQQLKGVFSSQEWAAAQQQSLMELDLRRQELIAQRATLQSLESKVVSGQGYAQLQTLMSIPGLGNNQIVSVLFQQLVRYETALDSLTTGEWQSAPSNPDVSRLRILVQGARERLAAVISGHLADLDARISALDDLRSRNVAEMRSLPAQGAQEIRLAQRVEGIRKVADQLREEYQRALIEEAVEAGQVEVVDLAALPMKPVGSSPATKFALALVLGLMVGSGAAFLKENLNSSIHRKDELEGLLRLPGLAVIPQFAGRASVQRRLSLLLPGGNPERNGNGNGARPSAKGISELVTISDLRSSGSEAYRTLRTNLIFSQAVQSLKTLVITSTAPAEGKTTTAANLAVAFAQQGMRVLIVDADLRKGRLQGVFGVPREPGLTQLVLGHADASKAVYPTEVDGLFVLPSGTLPPNPLEFLGGAGMKLALDRFTAEYDLVILDTAPLLAASDAAVLGKLADGVLLVVRAGHTDRGAAQQAVQQLRTVGAHVVGAVLNDPEAKVPGYGGYYYYGYYGAEA